MKNGGIYYIDFSGNKGSEINKTHLAILFTMPKVSNMVFCIPLTSPKEKHFKDLDSFNNRNYLNLKYQSLIYIKQTDSIALLDQMRSISIYRIIKLYKNTLLNDETLNLVVTKTTKYLRNIIKKDN